MKTNISIRLLVFYLAFGIISFILIATYTHHSLEKKLIQASAKDLYAEATRIASGYGSDFYKGEIDRPGLYRQVETLSAYMDTSIQIINTEKKLLVDSAKENALYMTLYLDRLDLADFGKSYYMTGDFYGSFEEDQLTAIAPVSRNYHVVGYVLIHRPLSLIYEHSNDLLNSSYLTFLLIYFLAFLMLLPLLYFIYRPVRQMSAAAAAYMNGDFSKKLDFHRNDELGRLAASLDYISNELNTLEDDQRKFVSNVSHDFRSPLTSIKGYVEAMLDGTIPPEMQEKYLNIILFETERLNKLTSSILELNKYQAHGKTLLDLSDFDINYIIRMTALTFEGTCKEKRVSIQLILSGHQLFVRADKAKIQQVIYNLTDNAIKFSHADSSVTIETTEKNDKVFVSVKDTGIGIPKDSLGKIWERFYKSDLSRGKDKKGSGLGLAIVKEIIQAHNENINVISTQGVGTEFIFTLPESKNKKEP